MCKIWNIVQGMVLVCYIFIDLSSAGDGQKQSERYVGD